MLSKAGWVVLVAIVVCVATWAIIEKTPLGAKRVITVSHLLQRLPLVPTWAGPLA